jgi:hypothetical protein
MYFNQIIIVREDMLSKFDYHRFGIDILEKRGFSNDGSSLPVYKGIYSSRGPKRPDTVMKLFICMFSIYNAISKEQVIKK